MPTILLSLLFAAFAAPASSDAPARETRGFRLYKFQQPIGVEETIRAPLANGAVELRTTFSFTDRRTSVPLASVLELAPDGSPRRLRIWGSTSRWSRVDDGVELRDGKIAIEESGRTRTADAPERF